MLTALNFIAHYSLLTAHSSLLKMSDIKIIINGGNNQILPNATQAIQYFYGSGNQDESAEDTSAEQHRLALYINKERIPGYLAQIGECKSASELAKVVLGMVEQESLLTPEDMVKGKFISLLLPHATRITSGATVDNVRKCINDAWMKRPRRN